MPVSIVTETQVMNFLYKFPKVIFIFFPLILFLPKATCGQITHFELIENSKNQIIHPEDFSTIEEYFQITFDIDDNIYIAALNRILKYDGKRWSSAGVPGRTQLAVSDQGTVYACGLNSFGIIQDNRTGNLSYKDLLNDHASSGILPGQIQKIIIAGEEVYLLAEEGLYKESGNQIEQVLSGPAISDAFGSLGQLYLYIPESGLLRYSRDSLQTVLDPDQLSGKKVVDLVDFRNKTCIRLSGDPALYTLVENGPFETQSVSFGSHKDTHSSEFHVLNDSLLLLIREGRDLLLYDDKGVLLKTINRENGIHASVIRDIYYDNHGHLWILHRAAISKIELNPPIREYGSVPGQASTINSVIYHLQTLFLATDEGVYSIKYPQLQAGSQRMTFNALFDHRVACNSLLPFSNSLLMACEEGVYQMEGSVPELEGSGPELISDLPARYLSRSITDSSLIYIILDEGFTAIRKENGSWKDLGRSYPDVYAINSIYESGDGTVWISTDYSGVFRSAPGHAYDPGAEFKAFKPEGITIDLTGPVRIFRLDDQPVFSTPEGLFSYDPDRNNVIAHPMNKEMDQPDVIITSLHTAPTDIIFLSYYDPVSMRKGIIQYDPATISYQKIITYQFRGFDHLRINAVSSCPASLWLATTGGLIIIDRESRPADQPAPTTFIDRCIFDNDSLQRPAKIPHSVKQLLFECRTTELFPAYKPLFQYRLEGHDDWSEWTESECAGYANPGAGDYRFMVRSMDQYGRVSDPDLCVFRISAPLYLAWWAIIIYLFIILFILFFYRKWKSFQQLKLQYRIEDIISERTEVILKEKEQTDNLLANILPKKTADELKKKGKVTSSKFKMVTVLFSDIQGFTKIAEQMNPEKLIDELDSFYFQFDTVVEKYNIEKIKTIGDAYMAAGGIPVKNRTNPVEVVLAALEMQYFMHELKKENAEIWDLRIGIHTGSVIAGVVGQKKFSYDIWGDTVNTASRMESSGEIGRVNISGSTFKLVQHFFDCEYRGKMPVKYKGELDMYFVKGLKAEFQDVNEYTGNNKFQVQVQLLRLLDIEEVILQRLEQESPEYLFYHNAAHTYHVYTQVELLGRAENISDEDLLCLRTAALLHDIGYLEDIEDHEIKSVEAARKMLPEYKFTEEQIEKICELILATSLPPKPKNLLEQIICDSNLDHLGRVDFLILSDKLFQEYRTKNLFKSKRDWNIYQIDFLKNHDFFTAAARKLREVSKEEQIENIKQFS